MQLMYAWFEVMGPVYSISREKFCLSEGNELVMERPMMDRLRVLLEFETLNPRHIDLRQCDLNPA